jgi:hypothetical protein
MYNLQKYANRFFDELEVFEDVSRGHNYKAFLRQSINEFIESETKQSALAVYDAFFGSYRITLGGADNRFIDLLDVLRDYEENAATLIDWQRDHYIHSVNVFILGLCIYIQNANFRVSFTVANLDKSKYKNSYDTKHEEFFYRWGIASLFHDVGYPIEIIGKQLKKFMEFVSSVGGSETLKYRLEFENFEELNRIAEVIPREKFTRVYREKYTSSLNLDLLKPIDLLAHKLHISLGVDLCAVKAALDGFVDTMSKFGFIDHGFYSAIIVLKWYGFLIQSCEYKPEYFFYPVLDSASAILLHNYYKNVIMKSPFEKGYLSPHEHPIAFLLMLCDELQEWDREAYGILDKKRARAGDVSAVVTDERLDVTYITEKGKLPDDFPVEKEALLDKLLDMNALFSRGFSVGSESVDELAVLAGDLKKEKAILPRPLLDNLEKMAIAIHELFNKKQMERYPDKQLEHPNFSDLPDSLKYSNLRQAKGIAKKFDLMGWEMRQQESEGERINEISDDIVERLAAKEHEEWMQARLASDWAYGEKKNTIEKISPYLVPYDQLSETVKDQDRDVIRSIPELLDRIRMAMYQKDNIANM